ncbi:MAG TPA: HAMP domain-containing sensor histidine kinase [Polyangiales bacterium]|nr:HAMP domain-containing sensor histidine kinase [Polyangiales bacterium]
MSARVLAAISCGLCAFAQVARAEPSFSVRSTAPDTFVVERARSGDPSAREGFVVDADALLDTLRNRVLEEQGLGNLARVTALAPEPAERGRSLDTSASRFHAAYTFKHHFAAPFEAMEARLDLAPLDDEGAFDLLFRLSALLALAVVLGLYALYRMVAVQVRFAERRNNFVAAVSHELKTPLTAIRMYGEMLRDGMLDDDAKRQEYYVTITSETERLSRLINNVLELSLLERSERPIQMVVGDVGLVVREVVDVFRPHAEREGFKLELIVEPALAAAQFDRDALTQVLFNLLDNALKYGRAREPTIVVRCAASARAGVRLSVSDRGPGVDDDQLEAIFEPFYRAQNELTRTQKGTGIGLALVRGLVERMRGTVEGHNLHPGFEVAVTLVVTRADDRR